MFAFSELQVLEIIDYFNDFNLKLLSPPIFSFRKVIIFH